MNIGYLEDTYPNKRCILEKTKNKYIKMIPNKKYDLYIFKNRVYRYACRKFGVHYKDWDAESKISEKWFTNTKSIDLFHLFNYVPITSKNWVCTFESNVPVTDQTIGRSWEQGSNFIIDDKVSMMLLKQCAKDNCIGLIALSQSAYNIELSTIDNSNLPTELKHKIKEKLHVVHPPQKLIINENELLNKVSAKKDIVKFIFIGHDFFRKGGNQIISAFERLDSEGYHFELHIISKIIYGDYASLSSKVDYDRFMEKKDKYSWVHYYSQLDNEGVLNLAINCDVGLLPSLAETYGYAVLELMACGCPVVTTNIRALGEINDTTRGWLCDISPNIYGETVYANLEDDEKNKIMGTLENELYKTLRSILDNPYEINSKSVEAYNYVKQNHSESTYEKKLMDIYNEFNNV